MVKKAPFFKSVNPKINFPEMEREILEGWYEKGVVAKYLHKNKSSRKLFSFIDGPITANNPMAVHHAWGRTYKDLWQRYKNMQGYRQRFQNGFDCQGLWVEVGVEKDLGFNSKKDIEKYGLDRFAAACQKTVGKYSDIQTKQSKRLGQFMDWENSYFTHTDKNIEHIWYFLKICQNKGWLYRGFRSLPWCARCGTSLSQHELTDSYQEITHKAVFLKLPVKGGENEFFLVWTTTPWTLAANVALAINPDLDYLKVRVGNDFLFLAKNLLGVLKEKDQIVKEFKGKELVGLKYTGPFDELAAQKESQRILIPWTEVSEAEGTGIVHIAPGCGEEDFELGKKHRLKVLVPLDENGVYIDGYGELTGKFSHEVNDDIFAWLEKKGFLYRVEDFKHQYPICWRCKEPIVFRAEENWFISSSEIRHRMLAEAKKVKWTPKFTGKLMEDWLKNMGDWNISRKRYFGLPLPFYPCECGEITVVGSKKELAELAVDPEKVDGLAELHRPWIDEIMIRCPKCSRSVKRITDIGDCWLDAGIVPFSTLKYLEDKNYWQEWFPAEWICEMREQVRLWFYAMLFMSVTLEDRTPYLQVSSHEKVYDEKGKPMHKSAGNAIWFDEAAEKIGADVMRWMYVRQNPADNLLFGYQMADEARRRFHLKLWNVYNFFVTYANLDGWKPAESLKLKAKCTKQGVLDRWILLRLNQLIAEVTQLLNKYDAYQASAKIEEFVDDLSNWYVRRSRERVGPAAESKDDKIAFYETLYLVLVNLSQTLAPFTPFMAEQIYRNLTKEKSVHLSDWPEIYEKPVSPAGRLNAKSEMLIDEMQQIREIVEKVHAERKAKAIPVRQPLKKLQITNYKLQIAEIEKLLLDELNIKEIEFEDGGGELRIKLDTTITPELEEEAMTRELIRKIQAERKNLGINIDQRINVENPWLPVSKNLVQRVLKKAMVRSLIKGESFKVII